MNDIYYTKYRKLLEILIEKVSSRGSKIIFITQTSGYGMNSELFTASRTIIDVCNKKGLFCIDVAKNLDLQYEDFYDSMHLTINGSNKVAKFFQQNLKKLLSFKKKASPQEPFVEALEYSVALPSKKFMCSTAFNIVSNQVKGFF